MIRPTIALVCLLVGALFAHGGAAQAAFAPTNDEIVSAEQLAATGFATDAQGNSIIAWSQETPPSSDPEVRARRLDAGGGLGPIIELAPGEIGFRPDVAMTPSGRAFAAWRSRPEDGDPYSIKGRWIEPDGSLGPLLTLVEGGTEVDAGNAHVVVDPAGIATVAWENQDDPELSIRRVEPDSTLGTLVPDISEGGVTGEQIAALPGGETVAVWRGTGIELNIVSKTLVVGTPGDISEGGLVSDPWIAVDSLGNGLVVWRASEGEDDSVRGRRVGATGALGAELMIDPNGEGEVGSRVDVSADTQNDFVVTWSREDAEEDAIIYARRGNNLGVPAGPAQPLSPDGEDGIVPKAALEDGGTGAVVWRKDLGSGNYLTFGRSFDPLAAPIGGAQELLPEGGETEVAGAPAAGFAAFLIEYPISGSAQAAVVRRSMLPPTCADSTATVVQGQPIDAPLACTGLAIEGAQVVQPPQHGVTGVFSATGRTLGYTPTPGFEGTDSFTYAASNDGGSSNLARIEITVGKDTVPPTITSLRFVQKVQASAKASAAKGRNPKTTYEFKLRFSEPATSRVVVERAGRGIRRGKRCAKPQRGARGKRCTRWRSVGSVSGKAATSEVTLRVRGKLVKALRRGGRLRAKAVATDLAGNGSKPRTRGFRVKKPKGR
jgi:Bacterial Ig domain